MKIALIYFTGTFNTRYLTDKLKNKLIKNGHSVDSFEINTKSDLVSVNEYDLIGISYPIHAFNVPKFFIGYLRKLPFVQGQKIFIYKQSGETLKFNNASSRKIKKLIRKKKCKLVNEKHYVMPYNIHFRYEDSCIKEAFLYMDKLLDVQIYEIEHSIIRNIHSNMFYNFVSSMFTIQQYGAALNSFFYRVDDKKCVKCYKCLKSCPMDNISLKNGKLKFSNKCMMCMRCSFFCPTNAIKIGMLEGWKVNGAYNFNKIMQDENIPSTFIKKDQKGFFKCLVKSYKEIDEYYSKYFKDNNL